MKANFQFQSAIIIVIIICISVIIPHFVQAQVPIWLPSNGLLAWYPFNGNANDQSGNNRHGTVNGGATLSTDRFGNSNSAYQFNGASGYIRNDNFPTNLTAYSYAGWYKSDQTFYNDCNVFNQTGFNASGEVSSFGISCANTYINARHRLSNMNLVWFGGTQLDVNWNYLVTTWDGQWVRVYKNGIKIDSAYYPSRSVLGSKFFIGCGFNYGSQIDYFFQGKLDDIAVYSRALTPSEISGMYLGTTVPPWLPANGLVAWYPFNGNANDESGNNRHGTVNGGATLTTDRFGNSNSAYDFDGTSGYIRNDAFPTNLNGYTYFGWYKSDLTAYFDCNAFGQTGFNASGEVSSFGISSGDMNINARHRLANMNLVWLGGTPLDLNWNMLATTWDGQWVRVYANGVKIDSANLTSRATLGSKFFMGCGFNYSSLISYFFNGKLDDIGVYNRALTPSEITSVFNGCNSINTIITPVSANINTGSSAVFNATSTIPNPSFLWQSNPINFGWQNLPVNPTYSGTNSNTLTVNNVNLTNHLQSFRVISAAGNCTDTSNTATINIADTCIIMITDTNYVTITDTTFITVTDTTFITITDTTFVTVTDTLIINTAITGLNPPNNINSIKVYPNPTNDYVTIDYGNFAIMSGYYLKIANSLGQVVFTQSINQQTSYLNLASWGGNGIYYVLIVDPQNNLIDTRVIVLQ